MVLGLWAHLETLTPEIRNPHLLQLCKGLFDSLRHKLSNSALMASKPGIFYDCPHRLRLVT